MGELKKITTISLYTLREIVKSKILYNVFFLGIGLLIVTYVAQQFTYGEPSRIALDFGIGALGLSSIGIAIFMGVGLLSKEIENRTVYMIIARPVRRTSFVLGRLSGLALTLLLNILLLSILTLTVYFGTGGNFHSIMAWTMVFIALEAIITLLIVSFLSLLTSSTLAVIISIVIYLAGHAIKETQSTLFVRNRPMLEWVLEAYQFILPAFGKINTRDLLIYNTNLEASFIVNGLLYCFCYSLFLITLTLFIFEKKNLD